MRYPVADPVTIETTMRDGARLVADVYRPVGAGACPVLLMRQPYGRRIASTVVLAHPAWYASHGYVVMVQDVRGRGDSEGRFDILAGDVADGAETLDAAAGLAGGDGRVATYGFSYQGMTQFMALAGALRSGGARPSAMAIAMAPWNVRDHWAFEGGAFRLEGNQYWAVQMAAEQARVAGDAAAYHAIRSALGRLCSGPVPARLDVLDTHRHLTHYHDWLADDPGYWAARSPHAVLAGHACDVPSLHLGGWLDIMIDGTFAAHEAFAAGGARAELMVGPWPHIPWSRHVGALDCGPEAATGGDAAILGFFDHVLKDAPPVAEAIRLFDLGRRTYVTPADLGPIRPQVLHLGSTGRACPTVTDGVLAPEPQAPEVDRLVHDPWRPAPAHGLALGSPGGYQDRSDVDGRGDVAVYTSAPLAEPLTLAGRVGAEVHIDCDRPSFDVAATLSIVSEDGRALAIAGGFRRVAQAAGGALVGVGMHRVVMTVPAGARLRLSLQAAAWPAFMVNPGTGRRPEEASLASCLVTTLAIRHGAGSPSRLILEVAG
ncbi:CocE/NonD family hydrolase [Methyloraptor flagellatus]|uniref:CocE/NonD family hydrolase n=1 Tax=Methyloraptor flagellatus TaxID=3162530 RepID=A0AAU7X703_9HYPH